MRMRDLGLVVAAAALAGCGGKDAPKPGPAAKEAGDAHGHEAKGPHGGEVAVVGDEVAHLEIVHDEKAGDLTLHVLGADVKTPKAIAAPVLNLTTKSGPVQIPFEAVGAGADGTAAQWKARHDALKADPLDGRVRVTIDGKTHQVSLAHEH